MKIRYISTLAMAAAAAAIGLAPIAAAAPTGTLTTNTGAATVVQSPGNARSPPTGVAAVQASRTSIPFYGSTSCCFTTADTTANQRLLLGRRLRRDADG